MRLVRELEKLIVATIEIKYMLTSSKYVEKIFILPLRSPQWVNNSEIDADNSQVSSTAVLLIGTTHGHLRLFTQLLTDSTLPMKLNLVSLSILVSFVKLL